MPNIPLTNKIHTVTSGVETVNKGSAQANAGREAYTIQDLADTIGGGGGVDSIVAGDGITVSEATGDVTVSAKIGGASADSYIGEFTADDAIGASKIFSSTTTSSDPTGSSLTYANYSFGDLNNPGIATFQKTSMVLMQTQDIAPRSSSTGGFTGQIVIFHDGSADDGIYVCTSGGAGGSATWKKAALTLV